MEGCISRGWDAAQRLLCWQSRDPAEKKKGKLTLASVALDLNRGAVIRWFDLGGERSPRLGLDPDDRGRPARTTVTIDASERPERIVVLTSHELVSPSGEVWFILPDLASVPRHVASLPWRPKAAFLCGDALLLVAEDAPTARSAR